MPHKSSAQGHFASARSASLSGRGVLFGIPPEIRGEFLRRTLLLLAARGTKLALSHMDGRNGLHSQESKPPFSTGQPPPGETIMGPTAEPPALRRQAPVPHPHLPAESHTWAILLA